MNDLSERDKIIINLKSELFDIQQNVKNIKKLEASNTDYLHENEILHDKNNQLEFLLNKTKDETSKQINDLKLEIQNLNDEINEKKETNIKLFLEKESYEKKINLTTQENNNLLNKIKFLMAKNSDNKILIEKYQKKIEIYENKLKNYNLNNENNEKIENIEKNQNIIKDLKEKYEKNINFFQIKINELQLAINQLYSDNKKLVKIYKISYNNKEIDENIIFSLINSNLLPKNLVNKETNLKKEEIQKEKFKRYKSNYDLKNFLCQQNNDDIEELNFPKKKNPLNEYLDSQQNIKKIIHHRNRNNGRSFNDYNSIKTNNTTTKRKSKYDDMFTSYGYDINKLYNFNKIKLIKNKSKRNEFFSEDKINDIENFDFSRSMARDERYRDNKLFYELIKTQEENILLKKQILNLAQQNEKIINEIDTIVKISGMSTIDVTSEGIKHLEEIIFNNRALLEMYLNQVKNNKT